MDADLRALDEALDPDATLRSLLLALMSRLLVTRGLAARRTDEGYRIEHVRGSIGLAEGEVVAWDGGTAPARLRKVGLDHIVPLTHASSLVAFVALGPRRPAARTSRPRSRSRSRSRTRRRRRSERPRRRASWPTRAASSPAVLRNCGPSSSWRRRSGRRSTGTRSRDASASR